MIGVTGTNGKTTTAFLPRSILEAAGLQAGLLGTVEQRVGGVVEPVQRTTPEAIDLQRTFRRMLDAGDRAAAIEVSSHALAYGRADGVRLAAAAFTNLTQDHLDFHGDMEAYFAAKALLFDGRCPRATNADDPYGRRLPAELRYAIDDPSADVARRGACELAAGGARFRLVARRRARVTSPSACPGASTSPTRSRPRAPRCWPAWSSTPSSRASPRCPACPAAWSPSRPASPSRCWWTTPTRRTRWPTCCAPRAT